VVEALRVYATFLRFNAISVPPQTVSPSPGVGAR